MLAHRTCTGAECDLPARLCQIDHIREFVDGGPTDAINGQPKCKGDNRAKEHARQHTLRLMDHPDTAGPYQPPQRK
jgi:HNH endonuclease